MPTSVSNTTEPEADNSFSSVTIALLKGILYQESDPPLWQHLLLHQSRVRDYLRQIGLELILDEAEGYAWLRSHKTEEGEQELPRLIRRHPLSFPVSLLLALLRKRLAEFDASGSDTRLILSRKEVADLMQLFLPENSNETKTIRQIESHINKIIEMGFLRKLRGEENMVEVRRILKSFVDAQWLHDFDQRLALYRKQLGEESSE
ncbi:MAG: DUF4194 domain-containing protein [Gammaproteobacteria bacterium]|jgi:hypothetical protein|nr:DUF4194 domain-containing protein [Gammaproteobacteria bacterium]MBT7308041.1 DUF4194 domain-containing protein [Gammaproteobacteria bacterium]